MSEESSHQNGQMQEALAREIQEQIRNEKLQRTQHTRRPTVVDVGSITDAPANRGIWVPGNESAFTLYLSRKRSPVQDEIRAALADAETARHLETRLRAQSERQPQRSLEDAGRLVLDSNVFGALQYAGETLMENLLVPAELEVVALVWPYTGGRLHADAFTFVEWRKPDTEDGLDALIVHRELRPTSAEVSADATIGREPHLHALRCYRNGNVTLVGATYLGAAAAAAWAMAFAGPVPGARDLADLGDQVVEDLSPDELIDLRLRALSIDIARS